MFQFTGFPPYHYPGFLPLHHTVAELSSAGFPHSDIHGSLVICTSPWLFAAYHVFLRLLVPRHPPCALFCLTCGFFTFRRIALRPQAVLLGSSCGPFFPARSLPDVRVSPSHPASDVFLDLFLYSVFKVQMDPLDPLNPFGLLVIHCSLDPIIHCREILYNGLKWTRTTDLTLIRRAL